MMFRDFLHGAHKQLFDMVIKQIWLELHTAYRGKRRTARFGNYMGEDWSFSHFMKSHVGISQKTVTSMPVFTSTATYLKDFFPDFLNSNPFEHPEDYSFPYKNLTLDHLAFVYKVHNRMELLEYAEARAMKYFDFVNWAVNQVLCYNDEIGEEKYVISVNSSRTPYINDVTLPKSWSKDFLKFYEETKARREGETPSSGLHDEPL